MENRDLYDRAVKLRQRGLTAHRAFRVLRNEFPHAERDSLVRAAKLPGAPTGYFPGWAQRIDTKCVIQPNGGILRPTMTRRPPKGA